MTSLTCSGANHPEAWIVARFERRMPDAIHRYARWVGRYLHKRMQTQNMGADHAAGVWRCCLLRMGLLDLMHRQQFLCAFLHVRRKTLSHGPCERAGMKHAQGLAHSVGAQDESCIFQGWHIKPSLAGLK